MLAELFFNRHFGSWAYGPDGKLREGLINALVADKHAVTHIGICIGVPGHLTSTDLQRLGPTWQRGSPSEARHPGRSDGFLHINELRSMASWRAAP